MITARLNKSVRGFSFSRRPPRSQGKGQWRGRGAFVAPITAQDTWIETGCLLPSDTLQSSVQVGSQILWRPINCRKNPNWSQSRSIPPDPSRPIHPARSIPPDPSHLQLQDHRSRWNGEWHVISKVGAIETVRATRSHLIGYIFRIYGRWMNGMKLGAQHKYRYKISFW